MEMMMVRIYLMEAEKQLKPVLSYLHDTVKVRGVTVFRGVTGFGKSGAMHSSNLIDLSLNLPLCVEFFDSKERVQDIITHLNIFVEPGHIVNWPIEANLN
jgi:PII-like signaling protein